jgi:hypothetical protein
VDADQFGRAEVSEDRLKNRQLSGSNTIFQLAFRSKGFREL